MLGELLKIDEELCLGKMVIDDANGILWIDGGSQRAARLLNGFQVARRNIPADPDQRVVRL